MANILTSLKRKIASLISPAIGAFKNGMMAWAMWVRELWPDIDERDAIEKGYADNTALYSIVNFDTEKFASIPRYVFDAKSKKKDQYTKQAEGPQYELILKLLGQPNPYQTQNEFLELVRIFYVCCGEDMIWLNRGDVDEEYTPAGVDKYGVYQEESFRKRTDEEISKLPVLEMYPLAPGWVGIIPDPDNIFGISGYWLDVGGVKKIIRKCDIIHWKRQNPVFEPTTGEHLRGLVPFKVGRRTIQENKDATDSMDRMFKNDGSKGVLVTKNMRWNELEEGQRQDIRDMIDKRINSNDVKGAVATLGGDWAYLDISKRSIDETLLNGKKFTWQELCFLLKVPYTLFDDHSPYNEKESAQKGWVSNTILPACRSFDQKLTASLAPAFNLIGKIVIWSDASELPEFQKDITALITAFQTAWYISPNKKLIALGFDPEPNVEFNEPWVPDGVRPLSEVMEEIQFNKVNPDSDGDNEQ